MTLVGRTVLHYEVTAELGAGAVGHVYLGRDTRTDRRVALKFIQSPSVTADATLAREARAAARLSHPGIVALFGLEHEADLRFLVEEYVDGETLSQRLTRGPLGGQESLRLARELAAALEHAHTHGVLHRDLKPENILIAGDGTYKIADFGIAKLEGSTPTGTGALLGTMPYMAPERMSGHEGDVRSDLFSLGAILYEALTGRRAFAGQTEAETVYRVMNEEPPPITGAGPNHELLTRLVTLLLAKEAQARPASAGLVRDLLVHGEALGGRSRRPAHRLIRLVGIITLLGIAAGLAWWRPWTRRTSAEVALTIAVLPFENLVDAEDREHLGPVISSLLVTDLAQLGELSVMGTERLFEILHQSGGLEGGADRRTARGIMRRASVGSIVTGKILQTGPRILLIAEVSAAASGHVLQAVRVQGEPGQTVFDVVDSLSARLIPRMRAVQGITATRSWLPRQNVGLGAYRDYVEGLESLVRGDVRLAEEEFLASVHQDPDFVPARTQLEYVRWLRAARMVRETP